MHTTLRSSFKLQKEKAEWQRITSDSANNTFFSIYAKFYFEDDSFTPKACDVKIQNYTGSITYGISKVDSEIKFIYDKDVEDYVFFFTIHLCPLHVQNELTQTNLKIVDFYYNNHYKSKNKMTKAYNSSNLMFVNLKYDDYHKGGLNSKTIVNDLNFIDQNHYLRDGDQLKKSKLYDLKDILDEENIKSLKDKSTFIEVINILKEDLYDDNHTPINEENNSVIIDGIEVKPQFVKSRPCRDIYVRFF
jgi:hypothetical protein